MTATMPVEVMSIYVDQYVQVTGGKDQRDRPLLYAVTLHGWGYEVRVVVPPTEIADYPIGKRFILSLEAAN